MFYWLLFIKVDNSGYNFIEVENNIFWVIILKRNFERLMNKMKFICFIFEVGCVKFIFEKF